MRLWRIPGMPAHCSAFVTTAYAGVRLEKGNYPTLSAFFAQMATD